MSIAAALCAGAGMLLAPAQALAGDGTFPTEAPGSPFAVHTSPNSIAVGDFNNDGVQDLATANNFGFDTSILIGGGDGSFTQPAGSPHATGGKSTSLAVGDFNNDGNEDLAQCRLAQGDVAILIGDGAGDFGAAQFFAGGASCEGVTVGDFNGDGKEDLAVGTDDKVAILIGNGSGAFAAPVPYNTIDTPRSIAVGDFNADGIQDLAIAGGSNRVTVRLGAGNGTFATEAPGSPDAVGSGPESVAVGDVNGDGVEDLVTANAGDGTVSVLIGAGDGSFPSGSFFSAGGAPTSVAVGDFNADGRDDLAIATYFGDETAVRLGAGDGSFPAALGSVLPGSGTSPHNVTVGDFNGDGTEDLAMAEQRVSKVMVRLGGGQSPLAGNLLVNGGFEGRRALQLFNATPVDIPGWQRTGNLTYANYSLPTNEYSPDRFTAARINGGENYLYPAFGADATASQTVDVSTSAASIDAGLARVTLSADLGGGSIYQDRMNATATFLDASGNQLGSFDIGPVTKTDRRNLTTLLPRSATNPVPAGTRQITVTLTARDDDANYNGATADNVKLMMDAPPPPLEAETPPADGGGAVPDTTAPRTTITKTKVRGRAAKLTFVADEPASFECRFDGREWRACSSPKRFPGLFDGKHVLQVRATDSAGNVELDPATKRVRIQKHQRPQR